MALTETELRSMFPNASASVLAANHAPEQEARAVEKFDSLRLVIIGQVRGGKNNMLVLRNGMHVPTPEFAKWSKDAILRVKAQLPNGFVPFDQEVLISLDYYAGDKRRRDEPAIKDSIWHVLERAGVVTDDSLLWTERSWRGFDKENPRVEMTLRV